MMRCSLGRSRIKRSKENKDNYEDLKSDCEGGDSETDASLLQSVRRSRIRSARQKSWKKMVNLSSRTSKVQKGRLKMTANFPPESIIVLLAPL